MAASAAATLDREPTVSRSPWTQPPWWEPRSAYLHVPFCEHQCGYCDFAVVTGHDDQIDAYLNAVASELGRLGEPRPVNTWFVGGGTPTHLSADQLTRLLDLMAAWWPSVPDDQGRSAEVTVESTPESLTAAKVDALAAGGVTRLSIGVQSFHGPALTTLDRRHSPEAVAPAVRLARSRGLALSLDLIFGVPGQSLADWERDLDAAVALSPDHVSAYGLTYETGTPLWKRRERGLLRTIGEEAERDMLLAAFDRLPAAGYGHYEVSNYARPGQRCRHNETYWANHAYFGVGLGAAGYVGGVRAANTRSFPRYLAAATAGEPATQSSEQLDPHERARETLMLGLRRTQGVRRPAFRAQTGVPLDDLVADTLPPLVAGGWLRDDMQSLALTREGLCVADAVVGRLLAN